jgi:hypothetical protein
MKIKLVVFYLMSFLIPINTFAVYDILSINITPTDNDIQFCFHPDYTIDAHTYLAAQVNNEFYFLSQNKEMSHWLPGNEPPIFSEKAKFTDKPICFDPFVTSTLQDISVYAGVGISLEEMIENNQYAKIFDGFAELPQPTKKWTIMVYMVGSDLEKRGKWASQDILEMLAGTSLPNSDAVSLVVSTGGSNRYGWDTIKRAFISNGQQYALDDLGGAKSMAEPQNLSEFVVWAKANFPAEHYALILWNHGNGTGGYGLDTSNTGKIVDSKGNFKGFKLMSLPNLHQAYKDIRSQIDKPLDVVIYDACLMASIEVAEITATVANAMAGSAELEPGHGIDYAHLLSNVGTTPPDNGLDFGRVVKTGYIQHAKAKGSFERKQITYSVFDLTQIKSFNNTFKNFAIEFKKVLEKVAFQNYEALSRGIIRAPGYPSKQTGRLRSLDNDNIRIDLYSVLQTVGPDFPEFKTYADELLAIIDKMVVDYEGNIANIDPNAGRVSLDIGNDKSYLVTLPEAYTLFSEGLDFYNHRKQKDSFVPNGDLVCPSGLTCAAAQWLELVAGDILGIEAYFGQKYADISQVYLIDPAFYQYQELPETLELGVDGHQACQYQLCVSDSQCEDITLTKQGNQLLADVYLNDSPTVLSFCNSDDKWLACSVAQQINGIWGRDDLLYFEDSIVPSTLHVQANKTKLRQGNALLVSDPVNVSLKKSCDEKKAAIWAMYYGLNQQSQIEVLCDSGDCTCKPDDTDPGCKEIGFKAGVYLTK